MWGKCSVVGRLAGPVPEFNTASLFFRRLQIGGVAIASYTNEETTSVWKNVLQTLAKTGAHPIVDHIVPMDEVPAAFARLHEGPMGKVLIRISPCDPRPSQFFPSRSNIPGAGKHWMESRAQREY